MKNRDLGPLGPSNLDPIYVIYVFGSMSLDQFVTGFIIASSINTKKWVVEN